MEISKYGQLEKRIAYTRSAFDMLASLPKVVPGVNPKRIVQEEQLFAAFTDRLVTDFSEDSTQADVVDRLGDLPTADGQKFYERRIAINLGNSDIPTESTALWQEYYDEIENNPGIRFVLGMKTGLEIALDSRNLVRNLANKFGRSWKDPNSFADLIPETWVGILPGISTANYGRFSVALMVSNKSIADFTENSYHFQKEGTDFSVDTFPFDQTVLGMVRERPYLFTPKDISRIFRDKISESKWKSFLVDQELNDLDYQVLLPDFRLDLQEPEDYLDAIHKRIGKIVGSLNPSDALYQQLGLDFRHFTDTHHEEFVVDFLLSDIRSLCLRQETFGATASQFRSKNQHITSFENTGDPRIEALVQQVKKAHDFDQMRADFFGQYDKVKTERPDKLKDLQAAYIFMPPSQHAQIGELVQHWLNEQTT